MDIVSPAVRSRMMSGIRHAHTRPEKLVRSLLHRMGFRFRLHDASLPGKPDLVLPKYRAVIFVHGCFWHCHGCHLFRWPATRQVFWKQKLKGNYLRDQRHAAALTRQGWRVKIVWECALRGRDRDLWKACEALALWLTDDIENFPEQI